jgi:HEAT repeat protein
MRKGLLLSGAMIVSALLLWHLPAMAQQGGAKETKAAKGVKVKKEAAAKVGKKVKMTAEVKEAAELLQAAEDEKKIEGIKKMAELADPTGVEPLIDLMKAGQADKVTEAAIDALGAISSPKAIPILIEYMRHRRAAVRMLAINAIAEIKDKQVIDALKNALKDSDANVRKTAALALGRYGDQSAVEILFKAFDRNVTEAAIAIGQIGNMDDMERLSGYLGKSPLTILLPGFSEFLGRETFPEKGKIKIIEKLKELAGPEVKQFLIKFVAGLPADYTGPIKTKAEEAIKSIAD